MNAVIDRLTKKVAASKVFTLREIDAQELITPEEVRASLDIRPELAARIVENGDIVDRSAAFIALTILNHASPADMDDVMERSRREVVGAVMQPLGAGYSDEIQIADEYIQHLEAVASRVITAFKLEAASKDPSADFYELTEGHSLLMGALTRTLCEAMQKEQGPKKPGEAALAEGKRGPLNQAHNPRGGAAGSLSRN